MPGDRSGFDDDVKIDDEEDKEEDNGEDDRRGPLSDERTALSNCERAQRATSSSSGLRPTEPSVVQGDGSAADAAIDDASPIESPIESTGNRARGADDEEGPHERERRRRRGTARAALRLPDADVAAAHARRGPPHGARAVDQDAEEALTEELMAMAFSLCLLCYRYYQLTQHYFRF